MPGALALLAAGVPAAYAGSVAAWLTVAHRRYREVTGTDGPPPHVHAAEVRRKWLLRRWQLLGPLPGRGRGTPVVLVHGFVARASHFRGLQVALHRRQRPTVAVELGWRFRGVDSYAAPVVDTLRLLARSHERVDVVTHSMGGLVLRSALAKHPELAEGLGTVVTLGTPHHGTEAARGLPARLPRDLSDLQPDSPWLQRLPPLHQLAPRAQLHAVGARYDVVAFPLQRVLPDGMVHHVFPGLGHNGLLTAPEVHRLVCALVATTPPPRPAG